MRAYKNAGDEINLSWGSTNHVQRECCPGIAAEYQVDLIVIGVHPAAPTIAHEAERTAYQVIRWSHCPVLTIRGPVRILEENSSVLRKENLVPH
jgi:hypothetical protein